MNHPVGLNFPPYLLGRKAPDERPTEKDLTGWFAERLL